jgi:hypothetical protein
MTRKEGQEQMNKVKEGEKNRKRARKKPRKTEATK